ncbi:MAG: HAD-IC family P-type ATPase, partial [Spirosomataceae bacterium]
FGDFSSDELLQFAASLNAQSEHPLAEATVKKAKKDKLELTATTDFESVIGKGVAGKTAGKLIAVGNKKLIDSMGSKVTDEQIEAVTEEQKKGKTVSYIAVGEVATGFLVISDAIKTTAKTAIQKLMDDGVEVYMLTGDNENTARAVAAELGLEHFKADCLPQDKLEVIKQLQAEGKVVAMAGDGINDAPALAQADIGIAMGTGTDVAIESAKITLLKGDLHGIVQAKKLSHSVMRNIKQNLFFAFGYNALGIPIAAGLLYPFLGLLLSPMIAAAAMSFSSVSVIANSLRLRSLKL